MPRRSNNFFTKFVLLLTLAVLVLAGIYFFFPALSDRILGTSWASTEYSLTDEQRIASAEDFIFEIRQAFIDTGATEEQISSVLRQIDRNTLMEAAQQALQSGSDAVEVFVEKLDESIDFGDLDTEVLKNQMKQSFTHIKFSDALRLLREYAREGVENLETVLQELLK